MKVTTEKLSKSRVRLTVEVPEEIFEESMEKAYKLVVKKVNVPGFRKGKAPRRMLEYIFGREILLEEALQDIVPKTYQRALEIVKHEYVPMSSPEYEMVQMDKGEPFIYNATFDFKPKVTLGQYKGLEVEKLSTEISDEDVDAEIKKMQERYAKLIVVENDKTKEGDIITMDFAGKIDGESFEGSSAENFPLELGSHTFIPGFEEQMIGIKVGESRDVFVTFPHKYHVEDLAGREALFRVKVKEIKRKEYAPIDDEFAKDVSEFVTMQELKVDLANNLKAAAEKKAEYELRSALIKQAAENASVDIPESMIENRIDYFIQDFVFRLEQQGINLEKYLEATNSELKDFRNNYRTEAENAVKVDLVLEAISREEQLQVTQEELDKEIEKVAEQYQQEPDKVYKTLKKQGQISILEYGILLEKAAEFIIENAKIK